MAIMFVYGTLKSGFGNNARCLKGAKSLGRAVTLGRYDLFNGSFPIMTPGSTGRIAGELFVGNRGHVEACDELEGHPRWYVRRRIWVRADDGRHLRVYAYVMPHDHVREGTLGNLIAHDADGICEWPARIAPVVTALRKPVHTEN